MRALVFVIVAASTALAQTPDAGLPAPAPAAPVAAAPVAAAPVAAAPAPRPLRLAELQAAVAASGADAWLFTDWRGQDELAARLLGLTAETRLARWWYLVPATGTPKKLVHSTEAHALDALPGAARSYGSWRERDRELATLLAGARTVAMDYAPNGELPEVGHVDAGTVELVRAKGPKVVSSAEALSRYEGTLTPAQLTAQNDAAAALGKLVDAALALAADKARVGPPLTERELSDWLAAQLGGAGFVSSFPPYVAVNANAADARYVASAAGSAPLARGALLVVGAAAKRSGADDAYADVSRTAWLGESPPYAQARAYAAATKAREAVLSLLRTRLARGADVTGAELDDAAHASMRADGLDAAFVGRTGHSLGRERFGDGANLDDVDARDTRKLVAPSCFTVEPSAAFTGKFAVRAAVDVCLVPGAGRKVSVVVPGAPPPADLPLLLK